jgi:DNA repair exonuclease SbcCD ATPase subunit
MIIQKIKIQNFKSIYDPVELDFNNIKGFWKISGAVGSGKTTIGEAIIFGLFGYVAGKSNASLISWGQKHSLIELWVTSKGRNIYIKREINSYGQSPIYVEVDGEEIVFTNKRDAQYQLETEYYDVTKVTMELLCIISFNNFKSLATLNSVDTKKFLDQVLGFYTLTQYADSCKYLKSIDYAKIKNITNDIAMINSQIDKLQELSNIELIEGDINETKSSIKVIENHIKEYKKTSKQETDEIINEINEKKSELGSLTSLGKNKKKEIDLIEKGTCPTCGAPIDQSQLNIKKEERKVLLEQYNNVNNDITHLNALYSQKINESTKYIDLKNNEVISQKNMLSKLEEQARRLSININEIETLKSKIKILESELSTCQQEDAEWSQLYDILSNEVRVKILESFIPILNKNILKYSTRLQQPYIIQFDSNFECSITICGYDNVIPISSLSTGQLKTVDMIIILGVLGTIMGSAKTNIMFLDELFSNLDPTLRNEMCMVLKENIDPDNTLFIISHQDLEDSYFDGYMYMKLKQHNQIEKRTNITIKHIEHDMY